MINNASKKRIGAKPNLPNVYSEIISWFQNLKVVLVAKTRVARRIEETREEVSFRGVIQPLQTKELMRLPEGERAFDWYFIHTHYDFSLNSLFIYEGTTYKIMKKKNWSDYGYYEYMAITESDESESI